MRKYNWRWKPLREKAKATVDEGYMFYIKDGKAVQSLKREYNLAKEFLAVPEYKHFLRRIKWVFLILLEIIVRIPFVPAYLILACIYVVEKILYPINGLYWSIIDKIESWS